jgi:hypothetical protein
MVQKFMIKKSGVEKSRDWTVHGQEALEQSRVEKLMVEMMSGVKKFMVERHGAKNVLLAFRSKNLRLESLRLKSSQRKSWGLKIGVEKSRVENSCNRF